MRKRVLRFLLFFFFVFLLADNQFVQTGQLMVGFLEELGYIGKMFKKKSNNYKFSP